MQRTAKQPADHRTVHSDVLQVGADGSFDTVGEAARLPAADDLGDEADQLGAPGQRFDDGFVPENQVRTRLPAGGRRIRTLSPPLKKDPPRRDVRPFQHFPSERDRGFESVFLRQRVSLSGGVCGWVSSRP